MKVRLLRKLAECIDGVDLSRRQVGEVFDLSRAEARLLIAEQWAEPARRGTTEVRSDSAARPQAIAADRQPSLETSVERIRAARKQLDRCFARHAQSRRADDP